MFACYTPSYIQEEAYLGTAPTDSMLGVGLYKTLTWNVRGLGNYRKRYRALSFVKRTGVQVACLQKTRLSEEEASKLAKNAGGRCTPRIIPPTLGDF